MKGKMRRNNLINFRKQKGWLQKDVVEKLQEDFGVSISESYYGMIEQGVRTPSLNVAIAIATLFEVDISEFFLNNNPTFCCVDGNEKQLA